MNEAFKEAQLSLQKDEVPIGAVIVWNNRIIARAHNLVETLNDPTAHAEMQAFTSATNTIGGKYLDACTLYVTVEPCVMCAGAAFWTQLGKIVYGTDDAKTGIYPGKATRFASAHCGSGRGDEKGMQRTDEKILCRKKIISLQTRVEQNLSSGG